MLTALLQSLRIKQWIKNLLIFIPLIFSREFRDPESVMIVLAAFSIFSLTASGVYLINDVLDRKLDQKHHTKKQRPIASGKLSPPLAILSATLLFLISFFLAWQLNCWLLDILVIYLILQLSYSGILKHIAIIDLFAIAAGFVLRVFAGAVVIDVQVSSWLLAVTFLLALLIAAGKRLREIEKAGSHSRKVLQSYSPEFLKMTIQIILPAILIAYLFYSFQAHRSIYFFITVPIAVYGLLRYLLLLNRKEATEDPTELILSDAPLLASALLWVVSVIAVLSLT